VTRRPQSRNEIAAQSARSIEQPGSEGSFLDYDFPSQFSGHLANVSFSSTQVRGRIRPASYGRHISAAGFCDFDLHEIAYPDLQSLVPNQVLTGRRIQATHVE